MNNIKFEKNMGMLDRMVRTLIAEASILGGYFFLAGAWLIVAYAVGAILLVTAAIGFCPLYRPFGIRTIAEPAKPICWGLVVLFVIVVIGLGWAGMRYGDFFSRKFFLEDYNRMNQYYKQTLFLTGQEKRVEAVANYEALVSEYALFTGKYSTHQTYPFRNDQQFNADLERVQGMIATVGADVRGGDLKAAHVALEAVRPVFQDILKRNSFSLLAVALVDFHDAMEGVIAASDAADPARVMAAYEEADAKLRAVEAEANDDEIQAIRIRLDAVYMLAKEGKGSELSAKAAELKSSFVKVYLSRG